MRADYLEQNSGKFFYDRPTVISKELSVAATNTTTTMVNIPAGAYVTKVMLYAPNTVANCSINVGDGDDTDRYIDSITTMGTGDIAVAPNVATAADLSSGETGAHYYATADTIDIVEETTASANTATGTVQLLVWYFIP